MEDLNLEDFTLVWLDPMTDEMDDDYLYKKSCIRSVINYLMLFKDPDECIDYILSIQTEKVFFVISGSFGDYIIPLIEDIQQILSIYIYKTNDINKYEALIGKYYKLKGVFTDISQLSVKLNKDVVYHTKYSMMSMSIFNMEINKAPATEHSIRDLSKENGMFLWSQLLFETLIRMPRSNNAEEDLLAECRYQYRDQERELEKIDDFHKNYRCDLAVKWYTRDSFLYRLLNKALRIQDIDTVFNYRFFIMDLYDQLSTLHAEFIEPLNGMIFTAYRGQKISVEELENLQNNIGQLISMNSFLSTTMDKDVAIIFAGDDSYHPLLKSILFEIEVDTSIKTRRPFANIDKYSYFQGTEKEILFSMGTVFRIESVTQLFEKRIWNVKLIYIGDNDPQLNDLLKIEMENITDRHLDGYGMLGYLLYRMGDYDKAIRYSMIREVDPEHANAWPFYNVSNTVAMINIEKGNYEQALSGMKAVFEHISKLLPSNHRLLGPMYNNFGLAYFKNKDFVAALECYNKANDILLESWPESSLFATLYNNIALVYREISNFSEALVYYNKSLEVANRCWPSNHPYVARTNDAIAALYVDLKDYDMALKYCQKALSSQKVSLPLNHPDKASIYHRMASIYWYKKDNKQALEYTEKCLQIHLSSYCLNNTSIGHTHHNLGKIYVRMNEYTAGFEHFQKALKYLHQSNEHDYFDIADVYRDIGYVYLEKKDYDMALKNFQQMLDIQLKFWPRNDPNYASAYRDIGKLYRTKNDYSAALTAYEKLIEFKLESLPSTHPSFGTIYADMFVVYMMSHNYIKAYEYMQRARKANPQAEVDFYSIPEDTRKDFFQYMTANKPNEPYIYSKDENIGQMYIANGNYTAAMDYFKKQLKTNEGPERATIYSAIGHIHFCQNNFELALENFKTALTLNKKIFPTPNDEVTWVRRAAVYNDLGRAYSNLGDNDLALKYYREANEVQQNLPLNHPDRAQVFNNIGLVYTNMKEYDLAQLNHEKALDIYKNLVFFDREIATTYKYLGNIQEINKNYDGAIENFDKAAEIYSKNISFNYKLLISLYNQIVGIYEEKHDYNKMLIYYEKVLKIKQHVLPAFHRSIGETYCEIFGIQLEIGDNTSALETAKKFLETQLHSEPNNYSELAIMYRTIGLLYERENDIEEALLYMEKAFEIKLKSNEDPDWEIYDGIGRLYEKLGDHANAIKNLEKALEIQTIIFPLYHQAFLTTYNFLALAYCGIPNFEFALKYFNELLEVQLRIAPVNYTNLAVTYSSIAFVLRDSENYELALVNFEKAVDITVQHLSPNNFSLIELYYNIGLIYLRDCIYDAALYMFIRALGLQQQYLSLNDISVAHTYRYIGFIYEKKGNDEAAGVFFQKESEMKDGLFNSSPEEILNYLGEDD